MHAYRMYVQTDYLEYNFKALNTGYEREREREREIQTTHTL